MVVSMLLIGLAVGFGLSVVLCGLALALLPWFRSGERKPGVFRPDHSTGGMRAVVVTGRRKKRVRTVRSSELPLVGGVAMVLAIVGATIGTGIYLNLSYDQWTLVAILLAATAGFSLVGFMDDIRKVYRGQGISELAKLLGVLIVALAAAIALNRLIPSARFAYAPYADIPWLGNLLRHTHFVWVIFFIGLTVLVTTTTSLAVDFSDGLDGLSGGLLVSAALSFAVIILSQNTAANSQSVIEYWPTVLILLAMVGALMGYLPFNWPSSYKAGGQGRGPRRARLIMGDSGALALGGALALITVISRLELLLLFVGGVFVLEGVSALISARILVKFFRKFLYLVRFSRAQDFAHTEFPLPFLATPMHHHFDLLGWDRRRLVYGAWTLGAGLAVLGVASSIAPFTWERYLARFIALVVILAVWQTGPWTRYFFIGLVHNGNGPAPDGGRARLGLFYGFPYKLFGLPLHARVDTVGVTEDILASPAERMSLWQRTSVFDARSTLGFYCFRAHAYDDAVRIWSRIPQKNLDVRPDIGDLLARARHLQTLESMSDFTFPQDDLVPRPQDAEQTSPTTPPDTSVGSLPPPPSGAVEGVPPVDPPPAVPPVLGESASEQWWQPQPQFGLRAARLEPSDPGPTLPAAPSTNPLWGASGWAATTPGGDSLTFPYNAPVPSADVEKRDDPPVPPPSPYSW